MEDGSTLEAGESDTQELFLLTNPPYNVPCDTIGFLAERECTDEGFDEWDPPIAEALLGNTECVAQEPLPCTLDGAQLDHMETGVETLCRVNVGPTIEAC